MCDRPRGFRGRFLSKTDAEFLSFCNIFENLEQERLDLILNFEFLLLCNIFDNMAARSKVVTPSIFRGGPDQQVTDWFNEFDRKATCNNWDAAVKLEVVPGFFEGRAVQ